MKITKINVWYSAKVQVRQFEPIEASMSVEVEITDKDDVDKVIQEMQNYCEKKVIDALPNTAKDLF